MSTKVRKRNIFSIIFGTGIDVEEYDYSDVKLPSELQNTLDNMNKKEENIKKGFNSGKPAKGGVTRKIDPKIEAAMRIKRDEVVARQEAKKETKRISETKGMEIGD